MSILNKTGSVLRNALDLEKMHGARAGVAMGAIAAAAMISTHPFRPEWEAFQDEVYGDPHAFRKSFNASVMTDIGDAFAGDNSLQTIQDLNTPLRQPKDFSPPGALVLGMWNARMGGR